MRHRSGGENLRGEAPLQPGEEPPLLPREEPPLLRGKAHSTVITVTACLAKCKEVHYTFLMIESFVHKGLSELFETGKSSKIQKTLADRALRRLDAIDTAKTPEALNIPGFDFHGLQGKPKRYSVHVNGPWCITFEWQGEDAVKLDFDNYH